MRKVRLLWAVTVAIGGIVFLLMLAPTVSADPPETWYVDPTGSDAPGCGALVTPCLSINYAISEALTGSSVILMPGVYTQTATLGIDKPIALTSQNGVGSAIVSGNGSIGRVILIESDGVVLAELEVRNGTADVIRQSGAYTGTVVTGTLVHDCGDECVQLANCTNCLIENVTAYDVAQDGLNFSNSRNSAIRNCEVYDSRSENGAIFVYGSSGITLENNHIHASSASNGIYVEEMDGEGTTLLRDNVIENNDFDGRRPSQMSGVAILVYRPLIETAVDARIVIQDNRIENNSGDDNGVSSGHGIYWVQHDGYPATIEIRSNQIISNSGDGVHAEVWVAHVGTVTVTGNSILDNAGHGIAVDNAGVLTATVQRNTITGNGDDVERGGGVYVRGGDGIVLVNNIVAANSLSETTGLGAGLYVTDTRITLLHTTIAENAGGDGVGLYLDGTSTAALTNTILVSHTAGVTVATGSTVTLDATLWYGNGVDSGGAGSITSSGNVSGAPAFVGGGDYHIISASWAVDAGVNAGIVDDVDGTPRPRLSGYDLGADEAPNVDRITLLASPASITANGLATTTLTATVEYKGVLQDGALVLFTTTRGVFTNWEQAIIVTTTQGTAVTWLRSVPASDTITATARASFDGTFTETRVAFTGNACQADLAAWVEHAANPVFDPTPKVYYPSVIYDADAFGHEQGDTISASLPYTYAVAPYYKMWTARSSANQGLQFTYSDDGLTWRQFGSGLQLPGLAPDGYHSRVVYDPDGFGGSGYYYKIWYWNPPIIYDIAAIRTADSSDGIAWENDQAVTQSITATLVSGNPSDWNRGSYGPVDVHYDPSATNSGDNPFDYTFVMYYDATTGSTEQVGLAYSADGAHWSRYSPNAPVFSYGTSGDWDASHVAAGTVIEDAAGVYHFWYSGGTGTLKHGIGYATSPDGIHWVRSADNPIFHVDDGASWRDARTYTPIVLYSATRFDGHGTPEQYKMWFTGDDGSNRAIGYATLGSVNVVAADTSGSAQVGGAGNALGQPFVLGLRDGCGAPASGVTVTFAISGTPGGAVGQSLSTLAGLTGAAGQVSTTLTLGDAAGTYTVTANASGVAGMPVVFTATALLPVDHFRVAAIADQVETRSFSITITAEDALNNTVTFYNEPVTLADSSGTISPTLSDSFVAGVLTQTITISTAQADIVITATHPTDPAVTGASNPFDVQALRVTNLNTGERFVTIQEAIDDADTLSGADHVISISAGVYNENVTLDKHDLTLTGAGAGTDPAQHTIIDGLTPTDKGDHPGITVPNGVTGIAIKDLRVQDFHASSGIAALGKTDHFVLQNTQVYSNALDLGYANGGLYMNGPVTDVLVTRSTFAYNKGRGIVIWGGHKQHITITHNTVTHNNCCGIELQDGTASGVLVAQNTVEDNVDNGIGLVGLTSGGGANRVFSNTLRDNGRFGIEIKLPDGTGLENGDGSIVVEHNSVERTFVPADARDMAGIAAFRRGWLAGNVDIPTGVIVQHNTVTGYTQSSDSDGFGIVVEGTNMRVYTNTVTHNDVGIQVQAGHQPYTPDISQDGDQGNLDDDYFGRGNAPVGEGWLTANTVTSNTVGIRVLNGTVTATHNVIAANVESGVVLSGERVTVTLGGEPLSGNTFYANGPGGGHNLSVTLPFSNPVIRATYNDWGVTDLAAIEDTIYHQADDPALGEVLYYGLTLSDDGSSPMADWVSYAAISATLTGLLDPSGNVVSFTTDLGVLGALTGTVDAGGSVTTIITSSGDGVATITGTAGMAGDNGMSDTTQVTFAPLALDHFNFSSISSQAAGGGFSVTVSARDVSDLATLISFNGWALLGDATGTLVPTTAVQFRDGVWSGTVTVTQACVGDVITATYIHDGSKNGFSNAFDVGRDVAATVAVSPASATVIAGQSITYTVWATDTLGNGWDATPQAVYDVESGAGGSWDGNVYASQFAGTWAVTATVDGTRATATLGVTQDELVTVQFDSAAYSASETAGVATITVTLGATSTVPVTVTFATSDGTAVAGSDYVAISDTLRFDVGQSSRTFSVTILADVEWEGDERVDLVLSDPVNAALGVSEAVLALVDNVLYLPLVAKNYGP